MANRFTRRFRAIDLAAIPSAPFGAWLALVLMLLMTVFAVLFVRQQDEIIADTRFEQEAMKVRTEIFERLNAYQMVLRGCAGLFAASNNVSRQQWKAYIDNLKIDAYYPGVRGIGFIEAFAAGDLAAHERRVRAEGFADYRVRPEGNRAEYAVVMYIEPFDRVRRRAFGYDMLSRPEFRAAMEQARDTGLPVLSSKIKLVMDGENGPAGFHMYWPLYRSGMETGTVEARRKALKGYVYAPFRIDDVMYGMFGNGIGFADLSIYDGAQPSDANLLYGGRNDPDSVYRKELPLDVAGKRWLLSFTSTPAFQSQTWNSRQVLGLAIVIQVTVLIFLLQVGSIRARRRDQRITEEIAHQTRLREERFRLVMEASPNAIVVSNAAGNIELVNAQTEKLFGYSRDELLGQPVEMLVPERFRRSHPALRNRFAGAPSARPMGAGRDLFALTKAGQEVPIEIGLNPIQTDEGLLVLSSIIDIGERKAAESRASEQAEQIRQISDEIARQTKIREERFRLVIEASPSAIVVTNAAGKIELVNVQVERLFGYRRDELLGQPVEMLVPERFRGGHTELRHRFGAAPGARPMGTGRELFGRAKNGKEVQVEIGLNPIQTDEGLLVLSSIIDISERKAAETRLKEQTEQIAAASRYKSEFLANMSHELRTPLNSIMILSEQLTANPQGNLTAKQVAHADIIHRSGRDLLNLINDILDLSKIEAGRMSVLLEKVVVTDFAESVDQAFRPMAENKGLEFTVDIEPNAVPEIESDHQRIFQIIRNLFSNSLKFTAAGAIRIRFFAPRPSHDADPHRRSVLAIAVTDTGIGIPAEKHDMIFEAFQQVDGSVSRRYGGTGLGLTISRQLADLLGGSIELKSELGRGSTFTLYLPYRSPEGKAERRLELVEPDPARQRATNKATEGKSGEQPGILIVENDGELAQTIAKTAREFGLAPRVVRTGAEALHVAETVPPAAIILDLRLPDASGWTVLRDLKANPLCRRVPVQVISAVDHPTILFDGLVGYLVKPIVVTDLERAFAELRVRLQEPLKRILLVEDNPIECEHYARLIGELGYEVTVCADARTALTCCREDFFGCMVVDLNLPDMSGFELIDRLAAENLLGNTGIIVNTGMDLGDEQLQRLRGYSAIVLTKTPEDEQRLMESVRVYLLRLAAVHASPAMAPAAVQGVVETSGAEILLSGKRILVVDDDIRNIYAMCSMLEEIGIETATAKNGEEALRYLEQHDDVELVLMDMMMPVMDGYAATRELKFNRHYDKPVVALTAHAMKGDREKCLEAGADDYLAKPVTNTELLKVLNKWIRQSHEVFGK